MYLQMLGLGGHTFDCFPTEEALEQAVIIHLHNIIRHVIHKTLFPHLLLCLGSWVLGLGMMMMIIKIRMMMMMMMMMIIMGT